MNTPNPVPSPAPATSGPTMPTLGSVLGSVVGSVIVTKTGQASDPITAGSIVAATTAFFTGLFHWIGSKLGIALS